MSQVTLIMDLPTVGTDGHRPRMDAVCVICHAVLGLALENKVAHIAYARDMR